jgi:SRSO17 transposase
VGTPQPGRGLQRAALLRLDLVRGHLARAATSRRLRTPPADPPLHEQKRLAGGRIDYEYAYFLIHAPEDAPLAEAVRQAGVRWKIEENNETAKQVTGLGQYQVRRWNSWHRHVTCAMLALAFLTVQRARHLDAETVPDTEDTGPETGGDLGKAPDPAETSNCP